MTRHDAQVARSSPNPFSDRVLEGLTPERRRRLASQVEELGPWTQGPFPLGGDLVAGADARSDQRWEELGTRIGEEVNLERVLVVGCGAGYDAFMLRHLGASYVLACEPPPLHRQARFLKSVYEAQVDFRPIGWQDLSRDKHGLFDLIHCYGGVHRELHPMMMLGSLRSMLRPGGVALIGGPVMAGSDFTEFVRFADDRQAEDPRWWWLHGRRALRRMLRVAGFRVTGEFDVADDASDDPELQGRYYIADGYPLPAERFPVAARTAPIAADPERFVTKSSNPPGHFYSPVPDLRKLSTEPTHSRVWPEAPNPTPGIDWRADEQAKLCTDVFAGQEPIEFRLEAAEDPHEYFAANEQFAALDGFVLQAMLRQLRPKRMIEIGSGFSSLLSARVNREYLDERMSFMCIEPYPRDFLFDLPGISGLRVEEVQETPLELFDELGEGDVLFVDTSHTVKTGGEVPWIFGQILPRLAPGVVVHVHDIYLPGEYPKSWVLEDGRNWNENYLVEAFLSFNSEFEVVLGVQWMTQNDPDALLKAFPRLIDARTVTRPLRPPEGQLLLWEGSGSSLWIRRRGR